MKASVKTLSERTGFSPATVSNALNYKRGVSPKTAEIIFSEARKLGYFTENHYSKVKFVMYKKDGLIVENTPFFSQMIAGAEQECRSHEMELIVCNLDRREDNFDETVRQIQTDKNALVILLGTEMMDEDIDLIRNMSCPFVVIDYWNADMSFNSVLINNADAARIATNTLFENGHRKVGYLQGTIRIKPFQMRASGYRSALRQWDQLPDPDLIVSLTPTIEGAHEDMKNYLASHPKLPTAFFADNDMIALGAMRAFWDAGIRVPEDVSVVGFDDLPYSAISTPPLTTLRVPKQEMGRAAVRRLMEISQEEEPVCIKTQICPQFIMRESVRTLKP